jgi:uncharacterized membrane protein
MFFEKKALSINFMKSKRKIFFPVFYLVLSMEKNEPKKNFFFKKHLIEKKIKFSGLSPGLKNGVFR